MLSPRLALRRRLWMFALLCFSLLCFSMAGTRADGAPFSVRRRVITPDSTVRRTPDSTAVLRAPATAIAPDPLAPRSGGAVEAVAFSPDGSTLAAADNSGAVTLWDTGTHAVKRTFFAHDDAISSLAWSPNGRTFATSGRNDTLVKLWDANSGALKRTLSGHQGQIWSVQFSPDGRMVAGAGGQNDNTLTLWNVQSGALIRTLNGTDGRAVFSPGGLLATGSPDEPTNVNSNNDPANGHVKLWNARTGKLLRDKRVHQHLVEAIAWSPDGKTIATAIYSIVKLWDVKTGKLVRKMQGGGSSASLVFSPDGRFLAGGRWEEVRVWDVRSGAMKRLFAPGEKPAAPGATVSRLVNDVAWSPDGRTLASAGGDEKGGEVRLWNVEDGTLTASIAFPFMPPRMMSRSHHASSPGKPGSHAPGRVIVVDDK